jgi:hypothetical protein
MKITSLRASNFIGARHIDIELDLPILLVMGRMGAGKSSICHAVRMAFLGDPQRVKLKKDLDQLVTDGAKSGSITIAYTDRQEACEASFALPSGKRKGAPPVHPALACVLEVDRFVERMSADERRDILIAACKVEADPATLTRILGERGHDPKRIARLTPALAEGGCHAAHREAKTLAAEARGAWKQITGEVYGPVKAETWSAALPTPPQKPAVIEQARADAKAAAQQLEKLQIALGEARAQADRMSQLTKQRAVLADRAALLKRAKDKLAHDTGLLNGYRDELTALLERIGPQTGGPAPEELACPHCGGLCHVNGAKLVAVTEPRRASREERERALLLADNVKLMGNAVTNDERDITAAERAAEQLVDIDKEMGQAPVVELGQIQLDISQRRIVLDQLTTFIREQEAAIKHAEKAKANTAQAHSLYAQIEAWESMAAALAPDGIRSEFMVRAINAINDRCATTADVAGWPRVSLDSDMEIRFGGRTMDLLSRGEKLCTGILLAEAIGFFSGLRLLMIDDADALDQDVRQDLICLLHELSNRGELDTAIVLMVATKPPALLPDTVQLAFLEYGALKASATREEVAA